MTKFSGPHFTDCGKSVSFSRSELIGLETGVL